MQGQAAAELFALKCGICHTIGKGKLIGPDLAGVQDRRPEEWLINFIRSSQTVIKNGDPEAAALFEEYNRTVMPDPMLSDAEIRTVLGHIAGYSGGEGNATAYESVLADAGREEIELGRRYFEGRLRLANRGPSCITCHNGLSGTFFSEKSYAKNLGASFSTLGEQGVRGILENPPFPVMAEAYQGQPLQPEEVRSLMAFLRSVDPESAARAAKAPGSGFLLYGLLGAVSLILLLSGFWYERKGRSVNDNIYRRQIKSLN